MNAKEHLSQIKDAMNIIKDKEEYIQRLRDSLSIAGISYDKDKIQTSPTHDRFAEVFSKIDEEEEKLKRMKEDVASLRCNILNEIQQLDNEKYRRILNIIYVDCKSMRKCASIMSFSYDYVKELHVAALQAFKDKFK